MKRLIINADDLGVSKAVNDAVERAYRLGILTSASLMANMPAFTHAVEDVFGRHPRLGKGIHFCLTSGSPVLPRAEIPLLADERGRFRHGFFGLFRLLHSRRREEALRQIARELAAQLAKVNGAGVEIDHADSHQHVHMLPGVFEIVTSLVADRHGVSVRVPREPSRFSRRMLSPVPALRRTLLARLVKTSRAGTSGVKAADRVYGVLDSGHMNAAVLHGLIARLPEGTTEVITHPAMPSSDALDALSRVDRRFFGAGNRQAEYRALLDESLAEEIAHRDIVLSTFREALPAAEQPIPS